MDEAEYGIYNEMRTKSKMLFKDTKALIEKAVNHTFALLDSSKEHIKGLDPEITLDEMLTVKFGVNGKAGHTKAGITLAFQYAKAKKRVLFVCASNLERDKLLKRFELKECRKGDDSLLYVEEDKEGPKVAIATPADLYHNGILHGMKPDLIIVDDAKTCRKEVEWAIVHNFINVKKFKAFVLLLLN